VTEGQRAQVKVPGQRTRKSAPGTSPPANRSATVSPMKEGGAQRPRPGLEGGPVAGGRVRIASSGPAEHPERHGALRCPCLITRFLDPTYQGRARLAIRWKPCIDAFAITFEGRLVPSTTN
jgi:hypothetical protein